MRFMMLYKPGTETFDPPSPQEMTAMGKLVGEMTRSGVLIASGGLEPSERGARVKRSRGKFSVTDGPFAETKELIAGYAIVEVRSKDEAIALAKQFLDVVGDGVSEVRLMHEAPERHARWRELRVEGAGASEDPSAPDNDR